MLIGSIGAAMATAVARNSLSIRCSGAPHFTWTPLAGPSLPSLSIPQLSCRELNSRRAPT